MKHTTLNQDLIIKEIWKKDNTDNKSYVFDLNIVDFVIH